MREADKAMLITHTHYLAENTSSFPVVLNKLLGRKKLEPFDVQQIEAKLTSYDKATELYKILLKKDDDTFGVLLDVLNESGNNHLADKLKITGEAGRPVSKEGNSSSRTPLEKNYVYLSEHLSDHTSLKGHLLEHEIISTAESEKIFLPNKGVTEMSVDLLDVLKRKDWNRIGDKVIQIFKKTGNKQCAEALLKNR